MQDFSNSVIKFGGTSVANHIDKIKMICEESKPAYVVVSAPGKRNESDEKLTGMLENLQKDSNLNSVIERYAHMSNEDTDKVLIDELQKRLSGGKQEEIVAFGEWASALCVSKMLGYEFADSKEFVVLDKNRQVDSIETEKLFKEKVNKRSVVPGFYGVSKESGEVRLFPRGGSDTTGAVIANIANLSSYENITDTAVYSTNPKLTTKKLKQIKEITFLEMRNLAVTGTQILQKEAMIPCYKKDIPIYIRNIENHKNEYTKISSHRKPEEVVLGISIEKMDILTVSFLGLDEYTGLVQELSEVYKNNDIPIEYVSTSVDTIAFTSPQGLDLNSVKEKLTDKFKKYTPTIEVKEIDIVAVIGEGMTSKVGVVANVTSILQKLGINIQFLSQATTFCFVIGLKPHKIDSFIDVLLEDLDLTEN